MVMAKNRKICKMKKVAQLGLAFLSVILLFLVFYKSRLDASLSEDETGCIFEKKETTNEETEASLMQNNWKNLAYNESPEKGRLMFF